LVSDPLGAACSPSQARPGFPSSVFREFLCLRDTRKTETVFGIRTYGMPQGRTIRRLRRRAEGANLPTCRRTCILGARTNAANVASPGEGAEFPSSVFREILMPHGHAEDGNCVRDTDLRDSVQGRLSPRQPCRSRSRIR
jgi:hypothetical protein